MNQIQFFRKLMLLLAFVVPLLVIFHFIPVLRPYDGLNLSAFIFFNLLCLGAYYLGKKSLNSPNKYLFNQLIMLNVIIKMIVSISIILIYHTFFTPETNWFVMPFLILYLIYTVFETYLLTSLVKSHT